MGGSYGLSKFYKVPAHKTRVDRFYETRAKELMSGPTQEKEKAE